MTKQTISQSQKRLNESLSSLFSSEATANCDYLFLKSSSDVGVERNGGRNGARLAPRSLLSYFKKLSIKPSLEKKIFKEIEISDEHNERVDFHKSQGIEAEKIAEQISDLNKSFICHLGGGHDHVYPLLMALGQKHKKIVVINIDAHADTRDDHQAHSGTPFRQFAQNFTGEFCLYQIALHPFANSQSTLSPLPKGQFHILWRDDLHSSENVVKYFNDIKNAINEETIVVFSLDADAMNGAIVPGVSAVNGEGLSLSELQHLWSLYQELPKFHRSILGVYELNPVYDTLSMLSMRTIGAFIYQCL